MKKKCSKCNSLKPLSEFGKRSDSKDGLAHHCKICERISARKRRERYKEANKIEKIKIIKVCPTCKKKKLINAFSKDMMNIDGLASQCKKCKGVWHKKYWKQNKKTLISKRYKQKYGITSDERLTIYIVQNGKCAVCGEHINYTEIQTDHCHDTGLFRGLVCGSCNLMLGFGKNDPEVFRAGAKYLENFYNAISNRFKGNEV